MARAGFRHVGLLALFRRRPANVAGMVCVRVDDCRGAWFHTRFRTSLHTRFHTRFHREAGVNQVGELGEDAAATLARERIVLVTLASVQFISIVDFMIIMPLGRN